MSSFSVNFFSPFYVADGKWSTATGLQLPGVLDEIFSYNGPLGAVFSEEAVSLYLWAPTAQVCLFLYVCPPTSFLYCHPL